VILYQPLPVRQIGDRPELLRRAVWQTAGFCAAPWF
jgi:hypothetical protein